MGPRVSHCFDTHVGFAPLGVIGLLACVPKSFFFFFLVGEDFLGKDACVVMGADFCSGRDSKAGSSEALAPNSIL